MCVLGVFTVALRPPITYATSPSAAAAACVVGCGKDPMCVSVRVRGSKA